VAGGKDRIGVAAGAQAENGTSVVEQIEPDTTDRRYSPALGQARFSLPKSRVVPLTSNFVCCSFCAKVNIPATWRNPDDEV
jgi:hypothetical protein